MPETKSEAKDSVKATDSAVITIQPGNLQYAKVKVLAEAGLFKNGQQYQVGDEAYMSLHAAKNFARDGDVEILDDNVPVSVKQHKDANDQISHEEVVVGEKPDEP